MHAVGVVGLTLPLLQSLKQPSPTSHSWLAKPSRGPNPARTSAVSSAPKLPQPAPPDVLLGGAAGQAHDVGAAVLAAALGQALLLLPVLGPHAGVPAQRQHGSRAPGCAAPASVAALGAGSSSPAGGGACGQLGMLRSAQECRPCMHRTTGRGWEQETDQPKGRILVLHRPWLSLLAPLQEPPSPTSAPDEAREQLHAVYRGVQRQRLGQLHHVLHLQGRAAGARGEGLGGQHVGFGWGWERELRLA